MAIREFSPDVRRAKIAFVGRNAPSQEHVHFQSRGLYLSEPATAEQLSNPLYAATLDAVLLIQDPNKLITLPLKLPTIVPGLLDQDVRVYVRLATDANRTGKPRELVLGALQSGKIPVANLFPEEWAATEESRRERLNSFLAPCVFIFDAASDWAAIANQVCDSPAGPPAKSDLQLDERLLIERFGSEGHQERITLLKRAFWNCFQSQTLRSH